MPDESFENEIVVTAKRIRDVGFNDSNVLGNLFNWTPDSFTRIDLNNSSTVSVGNATPIMGGGMTFSLSHTSVKVKIDQEDWNKLSDKQKSTFTWVLQNYEGDAHLREAMDFYDFRGVKTITVHVGPDQLLYDGSHRAYQRDSLASISYDYEPSNDLDHDPANNIRPGSTMVLNINSEHLSEAYMASERGFGITMMHEFLHPFAPDHLITSGIYAGTWGDHDIIGSVGRYEGWSQEAWDKLKPEYVPFFTSPDAALAYIGTSAEDSFVGSESDDILAGLNGNDHLDGAAGANALYGGAGYDSLVSRGSNDLLSGGADGDTYTIATSSPTVFVQETSGVDNVVFSNSIQQYNVFRDSNSLVIHDTQTRVIVDLFYTDGGRVETFTFAGIEYSASYLEHLAEPDSGGICYGPDGQQFICTPWAMPIAIDLDGDGLELLDLSESTVRFDVDGDGLSDRVAWVGADDGLLVIDRNGDGHVSDFSEITFLNDMLGAGSDFDGLLAWDQDGDGFITARDNVFSSLLVWQDMNSDGVSQLGELTTLNDAGLSSISLEVFGRVKLDQQTSVSQVLGYADILFADGTTKTGYDLALNLIPEQPLMLDEQSQTFF